MQSRLNTVIFWPVYLFWRTAFLHIELTWRKKYFWINMLFPPVLEFVCLIQKQYSHSLQTWSAVITSRVYHKLGFHYSDVTMSIMASQITGISIVCSNVCSGAHQRNHESFASLAFVRGIQWWPVDSHHKEPVSRKMFSFDDVIMC